jgi:hypothetical protein
MWRKIGIVVLMAGLLSGCAVGRKQDYLSASPGLSSAVSGRLAVGVQDRRPYILDHDKDEDFVGLQRGGYGNPFDVSTKSNQPLADDMAKVLTKSLMQSGARVTTVKLAPALSRDQVIAALRAAPADKLLLLSLKEWKSDTYQGTEIIYDAEMEAFDAGGKPLAHKRIEGTDQLGAAFWHPQSQAQEEVPKSFQRKREILFAGDIAKALSK